MWVGSVVANTEGEIKAAARISSDYKGDESIAGNIRLTLRYDSINHVGDSIYWHTSRHTIAVAVIYNLDLLDHQNFTVRWIVRENLLIKLKLKISRRHNV